MPLPRTEHAAKWRLPKTFALIIITFQKAVQKSSHQNPALCVVKTHESGRKTQHLTWTQA
eukprot:3432137-Amphidinium_carterae.1